MRSYHSLSFETQHRLVLAFHVPYLLAEYTDLLFTMHSLSFLSMILSLYISLVVSVPVKQRRLDLDGNGVPDICFTDSGGAAMCLESDASATTSGVSTATSATTTATGSLPDSETFKSQNGTLWTIEYVGNIGFTEEMQEKGLGGDKCRSSVLGGKIIWNCGDMACGMNRSADEGSWTICGFAMVRQPSSMC